ncbi:hypothetical protein PSTG_10841 [Puccinia striiformis f. sp. tritici PST-78]|uniref:Uncharacterized protein n=1 Tax=Puccinia striiformis f. sp. tritici PST-78 TaxID=1165861 RepID=A0A0L0V909_9BASI|nr:hypothetical protein PSTG_10841 [Puccinia striiformis f. sp. tritici PST-78]
MDKRVDDSRQAPEEDDVELARPSIPADDEAFRELLLEIEISSSQDKHVPNIPGKEWGGDWVLHPDDETAFDGPMLSKIDSLLKRISIPTWIKRAIPILCKASCGRLEADEWRNLFTIQLPLILPHLWNNGKRSSQSLLHNFAHFVSRVTVAFKQAMNANHIESHRHHIHSYVGSCLALFPDTNLAPNHHMVFHLANCLERFGPSRAWWSFLMEQMMAQVLKGQLEITHLTNFGGLSNLRALLQSGDFHPSLKPPIRHIRALLNELFPGENFKWAPSDEWHLSKSPNILATVNSRIRIVANFQKGQEIFSSMKTNKNNCIVALKPEARLKYGMIKQVFLHSRTPPGLPPQTNTRLALELLNPAPTTKNPFTQLDNALHLAKIPAT